MSNANIRLINLARDIAANDHPDGYNKSQLISASKKVFDGFAVNPRKEIKTHEDAGNYASYLSEIDGGYPRGLNACFSVGISGNCGVGCPAFIDGSCDSPEFDLDDILSTHGEIKGLEIAELYSELENEINTWKESNN